MHRPNGLTARVLLASALAMISFATEPAWAQFNALGGDESAKVTVKGVIEPPQADRQAMLVITAQIVPDWHIYSISQPPGGPIRSKIKLPQSADFHLQLGDFVAKPAAEIHQYADVWPGVKVEEHAGTVTWTAPLAIRGRGSTHPIWRLPVRCTPRFVLTSALPRATISSLPSSLREQPRLARGRSAPHSSQPGPGGSESSYKSATPGNAIASSRLGAERSSVGATPRFVDGSSRATSCAGRPGSIDFDRRGVRSLVHLRVCRSRSG